MPASIFLSGGPREGPPNPGESERVVLHGLIFNLSMWNKNN